MRPERSRRGVFVVAVAWVDEGNPRLTFDYRGFRASTHPTLAYIVLTAL